METPKGAAVKTTVLLTWAHAEFPVILAQGTRDAGHLAPLAIPKIP